jgi:hypothetical protein
MSIGSGHYWTYVYDIRRGCWIRFNDTQVTDVRVPPCSTALFEFHSIEAE